MNDDSDIGISKASDQAPSFRVECNVCGEWTPLFPELQETEANRVADFMRRGQPALGSVRVLQNEGEQDDEDN